MFASSFDEYEVIVIDDASTDDQTANVVREFSGIQYARLPSQSGPAKARNQGAQLARGRYLMFLDADVCVHPTTVQSVFDTLAEDESLDAVFGSYDNKPSEQNMISRFRNLLHHFVHQQGSPSASTFWAGCGAIKRDIFLALGGFNEDYTLPCIEDIEFGRRAVTAGYRIRLQRTLQAKHLKRWSFLGMVVTDTRYRGIPWTRLLLAQGSLPNDLNLRHSQRVSTLLAFALVGLAGLWIWQEPFTLVPLLVGLLALYGLERWSAERWWWLPKPAARALGGVVASGIGVALIFLQPFWSLLFAAGMSLGLVALNHHLYLFFARIQSLFFAVAMLPIHVVYFLVCGVSFGVGSTTHLLNQLFPGAWPSPGLRPDTVPERESPNPRRFATELMGASYPSRTKTTG